MARGDAPISPIYRLGEGGDHRSREQRAAERRQALYRLLWVKHGTLCVNLGDLPEGDPWRAAIEAMGNEKYGRRNHGPQT